MQGDVEGQPVERFEHAVFGLRQVETHLGPAMQVTTDGTRIVKQPSGLINDPSWSSVTLGGWLGRSLGRHTAIVGFRPPIGRLWSGWHNGFTMSGC